MEKDIIEEFINEVDKCSLNECSYGLKDKTRKCNLIRNLLKRYKELEENEIWSTATMEDLKTKFIPISVIQNKIDELENKQEKIRTEKDVIWNNEIYILGVMSETLKEILEKGNK